MTEKTPKEFFNIKVDPEEEDLFTSMGISEDTADSISELSDEAIKKNPDCISQQIKYIIDNASKEQLLVMLATAHIQFLKEDYGLSDEEFENPN